MKGLVDALRALGSDLRCPGREGFFPLEYPGPWPARGPGRNRRARKQPNALGPPYRRAAGGSETAITLSAPVRESFVEMTVRLMSRFGVSVMAGPGNFTVPAGRYALGQTEASYAIEPDATSASYFLALPLVTGGKLRLRGLRKPDPAEPRIARRPPVRRRPGPGRRRPAQCRRWARGSLRNPGARRGLTQDFAGFSDTFLTLAAISPLLQGSTRITGIAHTRRQETDRVGGMARELRRLGQEVVEAEDSLEIHPRPLRSGQVIETYGDHRSP